MLRPKPKERANHHDSPDEALPNLLLAQANLVSIRHERILPAIPEALRQKIGLQQR